MVKTRFSRFILGNLKETERCFWGLACYLPLGGAGGSLARRVRWRRLSRLLLRPASLAAPLTAPRVPMPTPVRWVLGPQPYSLTLHPIPNPQPSPSTINPSTLTPHIHS